MFIRFAPIVTLVGTVLVFVIGGLYVSGALTHAIYPSTIDDDTYYLARMSAVHNGYFNVGNPFYFEHRHDRAPAYTVPDIIAALPLVAGASLPATLAINFVLWSLVCCFMLYGIFRSLAVGPWYAAGGALFVFVETYWLIMRPGTMQVAFPVFLLYILGLSFTYGARKWAGLGLMAISIAMAFYVYSYLWQILGASLAVLILWHGAQREWRTSIILTLSGILGVVCALPVIIGLVHQLGDPVYLETMVRYALSHTHFPTTDSFYYGRWVILVMLAWFLVRRHVTERTSSDVVIYGIGFGLALANWSNILTGAELETGQHVGRFITMYIAFSFVLLIRTAVKRSYFTGHSGRLVKSIVALLILGIGVNLLSNINRAIPLRSILHSDYSSYDRMEGVIEWIRSNNDAEQVVMTDDLLATYIPIYTTYLDAYSPFGSYQLGTHEELVDRYLTARALQKTLTIDQLVAEMSAYTGPGEEMRLGQQNDKNKWCHGLRLDIFFGMFCDPQEDIVTYKGPSYWATLLSQWQDHKKDLSESFARYQVRYILWPKAQLSEIDLSGLSLKTVYQDTFYVAYELETSQ